MHLCTFIIHRIPSIIAIIIDFCYATVSSSKSLRGSRLMAVCTPGERFPHGKGFNFRFLYLDGMLELEHVVLSRFCCDTCPDLPCFSRGSIMQFDIPDVHIAIACRKPQRYGMPWVVHTARGTVMRCDFNLVAVVKVLKNSNFNY